MASRSLLEMGYHGGRRLAFDDTARMLGGPPRHDAKDEKIFSDEPQNMEKLPEMDVAKRRERKLREEPSEEPEQLPEPLKEEVEGPEEPALRHEEPKAVPKPREDHEYLAKSRIVAPDYFEPTRPEDEIPVAVATSQDQWRRQRIAKAQVQVASAVGQGRTDLGTRWLKGIQSFDLH